VRSGRGERDVRSGRGERDVRSGRGECVALAAAPSMRLLMWSSSAAG